MRIAVYSRKSKLTGRGESIENQIEMCREYIRTHYGENCEILVYEDEGFSGGNVQRPQFRRMLKDAREGRFDMLICYRLDRVSRNIADFSALIEELSALGIGFVSIRELFDTSTPMGRAMMYIASVFAQLERETIAERIRDNMLELAKTGRWLGGVPPTGYRSEGYTNVTVEGKVKKACRLASVEDEQAVVRLIFQKYLELRSLAAVEAYLLKNNILSKNGKSFSRLTIKGILENPVYAAADGDTYRYFQESGAEVFGGRESFNGRRGIMAYNKTSQKSGAPKRREKGEWIVAVGRHRGIISGAEWVNAQKILEGNENRRYRRPRTNRALLGGILHCGECGAHMRPKLHRKGRENFSYICEKKEKSRGALCKSKNISGLALDEEIVKGIKELCAGGKITPEVLIKTGRELLEDNAGDERALTLRAALEKNKGELKALIDRLKYVDPNLITDISREMLRLKGAISALETELSALSPAEDEENIERLADYILRDPHRAFGQLDIMERRALIRRVIKEVVAKGEGVKVILWEGE